MSATLLGRWAPFRRASRSPARGAGGGDAEAPSRRPRAHAGGRAGVRRARGYHRRSHGGHPPTRARPASRRSRPRPSHLRRRSSRSARRSSPRSARRSARPCTGCASATTPRARSPSSTSTTVGSGEDRAALEGGNTTRIEALLRLGLPRRARAARRDRAAPDRPRSRSPRDARRASRRSGPLPGSALGLRSAPRKIRARSRRRARSMDGRLAAPASARRRRRSSGPRGCLGLASRRADTPRAPAALAAERTWRSFS